MMSDEHSMRRVTAIRNGTVIDHIPNGQALRVLEMLGISGSTSVPVSLVMNVPSKKMGSLFSDQKKHPRRHSQTCGASNKSRN